MDCSTSDVQRWISKGFIIGLAIHVIVMIEYKQKQHMQPSEPQPMSTFRHVDIQDEDSSSSHHMAVHRQPSWYIR